jgi:hypothetical protein
MRMSTDSLGWAALAVGTVGAEFAVTAPPELRDLVAEWGTRFARAAAR